MTDAASRPFLVVFLTVLNLVLAKKVAHHAVLGRANKEDKGRSSL